ncbi:MAG TPA: hypothetical protein VL381_05130 [Rhodocyclaceae bacterium]|jgi:hypothetical protein|nr:hypothetical protein [Rhodocyclaceae bacterium]
MSQTLSRSARGEINHLPCVFATALRQKCAVCSLALHDAEQLLCSQPVARATCAGLHGQLVDKSRFALGMRADPRSSRTSKPEELRLQCGGLTGLRTVLDRDAMSIDVHRLLERLADKELDLLPWEQILRAIGAWSVNK